MAFRDVQTQTKMHKPDDRRLKQPAYIPKLEESCTLGAVVRFGHHKVRKMLTWFCSLRGFVDQNSPELELAQPRIARSYASAADNVCSAENLLLALPDQRLILPLIVATQFPLFVFQHDELLQLYVGGTVRYLLMESQVRDTRIQSLPRFGSQTDHLQTGSVNLLCELIDGNVGRRANENLARVHFCEVVND